MKNDQILVDKLILVLADSTIIEVIATAKIIAAIVPNSGTT